MFDLTGKRALITGASRGIGKAIAQSLAKANAEVVLTARDESALNSVRDSIVVDDGSAVVIAGDLSTRDGCRTLAACSGNIDILVNNAAMTDLQKMPIVTESDESWDRNIELSLMAPVTLITALAPKMMERGHGSVINISSVVAKDPTPNIVPYAAMKAALEMVTRAGALELAPHGVRMNAIRCGMVKTEQLKRFLDNPALRDELMASVPMGRIAKPEEVAQLCVYLSSGLAENITGSIYTIDGGMSAGRFVEVS